MTFHTVKATAAAANVSRQTLYTWLHAGVIGHPTNDLNGQPIFTQRELEHIQAIAAYRKAP